MSPGIALISYASAALGFFILCILLLTSWRNRLHRMALAAACLMTALWAAAIAYHVALGRPLLLMADILEVLRNAGWTLFLLMVLGRLHKTSPASMLQGRSAAIVIGAFYTLLLLATVYSHLYAVPAPGQMGFLVRIIGRVAMAVLGMLLVEQFYRNTPSESRWGIKFACLGMAGLFVYDFYLYSDAMLFRLINMEIWTARGVVNALIVPLIALSAARNPQWSFGISVSRHILFHSAALFGSAAYLLTMAAAGYYLRMFGGSWGTVMQVVFLFGAAILLLTVLFSGTFRSQLKVLISKHFFRYHYDYRDEWLRFTRALSAEGPGLNERTIKAIAGLMESPGGALFILGESGNYEPVANWNLGVTKTPEPADSAFCQFLHNTQWVIDLEEFAIHPAKYAALSVPHWLQAVPKARLVVPLIIDGGLFGFIILAQPRSKIKLNWEATDLLKIAGNQAASYLAQRESANALMVARQFESFNRMSTFMVHDLKNLVSQLSLLLTNAQKHRNNLEFQNDMLETVDYSVQKMKLLLQKLSRGSSTEQSGPLIVDDVLRQAVSLKSAGELKPTLEIRDRGLMVFADASRLERVIGHLVQNAIEATPKDGRVTICLERQGDHALIELQDTGHGMSEDFIRDRLFKPFESTKSAGMGIGVFESRAYIQELGGELKVFSRPSAGTTFRMTVPLYKHEPAAMEKAA